MSSGGVLAVAAGLGAADLDERQPDLGEGVDEVPLRLPETPGEPLDEGAQRVDREAGRDELGGWRERCRAASSKSPKAWLATTTSAGVSASWRRSSSTRAAMAASSPPAAPSGEPGGGGLPALAAPLGGSRRIGRSPSGVHRVLIGLP